MTAGSVLAKKKGVDVIVTYRSSEAEASSVVSEIAEMGGKAAALQLDASSTKPFDEFAAQVKQTLRDQWQTKQFDFLVNNAGIGIHRPFTETTEDDFDQLINFQFKGIFFLTQKLLPLLKDGGRIVNLSSGYARFTLPGYSAYASMKGTIEVLTRYMAKELGHRQIAANVVAPGAIKTDFAGGAVRENSEINTFLTSQTALAGRNKHATAAFGLKHLQL
ncbi:MAG: SDR family oxidoreductase [Bdellovibrionaceae bacterium]|nr:SDR family oxidoreductase [Pseudobdellovibrionaceae bacterium]